MDSLIEKLKEFQLHKKCTLLGVGPMSKNCVDVVIELANQFDIPIMLIASRRQIETKEFGGGYVNNWSTEEFAKYIQKNDRKNNIILCRDHGGPWQNEFEKQKKFSLTDAMESAKKSFEHDVEAGFEIIHLDASTDLSSELTIDEILTRNFELYQYVHDIAKKMNKKIEFELSIGKEDGGIHAFNEIEYAIKRILEFCSKKHIQKPLFLVIRTGNYVMETKNVGNFEKFFLNSVNENKVKQIQLIIQLLKKNNILLKEHNTDYLSDKLLKLHTTIGIDASNVAPEFGVTETKSFLELLQKYDLSQEIDEFVELAYNSKKWKKWILPGSNLKKIDKAIIAGHYIFSDPKFIHLKEKVSKKIPEDIDQVLKIKIKENLMKYLSSFSII